MKRRLSASLAALTEVFFCAPVVAQSSNSTEAAIAIVEGKALSEHELSSSVKGQLQRIRQREFELKRKGLEEIVRQRLLEAKAKKEGITTARLLERDVDAKVGEPGPEEVEAYFLAQKQRIPGRFEDVKGRLREALKQEKIEAARERYLETLEQRGDFAVFIRPPRLKVDYDPQRLRGSPDASVKIIEFSDFSCPFCKQTESTLKQVASKYQGQVSLAYRDFPLGELHPKAQMAAESARCAGEQGKFWEYHDLLFKDQGGFSREASLENARKLKLDEKRFAACLDTGKYRPQIDQDIQDGIAAGVTGTPAFFVNGVFLDGAQSVEAFERIIDQELQSSNRESAQRQITNEQ